MYLYLLQDKLFVTIKLYSFLCIALNIVPLCCINKEHVELCMLLSFKSYLRVYDWQVSTLSWLPRPQWTWCAGTGRDGSSKGGSWWESVSAFRLFFFLTHTPVLSISISRWLTNCSATDRSTSRLGVCLWLWTTCVRIAYTRVTS